MFEKKTHTFLVALAVLMGLVLAGSFLMEEQRQRHLSKVLSQHPQNENVSPVLAPLPPVPNGPPLLFSPNELVDLSGKTQEQKIRDAVRAEVLANTPPPPMLERDTASDRYSQRRDVDDSYVAPSRPMMDIYNPPQRVESTPPQSPMTTYFIGGRAIQCSNNPNASAQYCY